MSCVAAASQFDCSVAYSYELVGFIAFKNRSI